MSLKSSNQVATNRYQLEIELPGDVFEKAVEQVYRKENKKITIPGFRKGKAPRSYVEKVYGSQVFYEDAINSLYPAALEEAVKEAGVEFVEDKVDFDLVSAGKDGLCFKVTITTKPEVSIENYKGVAIEKKPVKVTDEDVDAEIKKVQDRNSRMVTVEDREAQNGDITVIDYEGFVDGTAFEGGKAENATLNLGSNTFIPGFEDQIVGHDTGEEFEINVKFPEEYQAENLKGKDATFKIKLHEIKRKELPVLDDEFAKDVSEFDTLDAYKQSIREKLQNDREKSAEADVENQILEALIEKVEGEIPEEMYDNEVEESINSFAYRLQSQGLNLETYLKYTGMTTDSLKEQFRPQSEKQVKLRLALEKIAANEGLEPTAEELDAEYEKLAKMYEMEVDKIKNIVAEAQVKGDLQSQKAVDFVKENAVVKTEE